MVGPCAALLAGLLLLQEPGEAVERALADPDPSARREAAEQVAALGRTGEAWILREAGKGNPSRQRAVLLAAALLPTPRTQALLERAARGRPSRKDPERAFALLLAGALGSPADLDIAALARMPEGDFERSCLLAGMLAQASRWDVAEVGRRIGGGCPAVVALLHALGELTGQRVGEAPDSQVDRAGRLLGSLVRGEPVPAGWVSEARGAVPELWLEAAVRTPPRSFESLSTQTPGGQGAGLALALAEVPEDRLTAAFHLFAGRLLEPRARAWLWGVAGERGLTLPAAGSQGLSKAGVGGLVHLALVNPGRARAAAREAAVAARRSLGAANVPPDWTDGLVLALAAEKEDLDLLAGVMGRVPAAERSRWQPVWLFASGRLDQPAVRDAWLREWGRELGSGRAGFLDQEGPRWVAWILAGGTRGARERAELRDEYPALHGPRDHPVDDELYADIAEFLLSGHYRWDLP